jgi:hypothetical protein
MCTLSLIEELKYKEDQQDEQSVGIMQDPHYTLQTW